MISLWSFKNFHFDEFDANSLFYDSVLSRFCQKWNMIMKSCNYYEKFFDTMK
jgi:hypothetical protein